MDMNKKEELLERANFILQDGVKNRDSLFHTLVLSSLCDGEIESRVMVLREFNEKKRILRFHSDFRSNKIKELEKDNKTTVIGYDPNLKVQIRLIGETKINYHNEDTQKCWESSQAISKKCYSVNSEDIDDDKILETILSFNNESDVFVGKRIQYGFNKNNENILKENYAYSFPNSLQNEKYKIPKILYPTQYLSLIHI